MAINVTLVKRYLKSKKRNGQREHRWTLRWDDPVTGKRGCESTGTADRTAAESLQKIKWAEVNGLAEPRESAEPAPTAIKPTWDDCRDALERAMRTANKRDSYVSDCVLMLSVLQRAFPELESPADVTTAMANEYKRRRAEGDAERGIKAKSPWTIRGDLSTLKAVFGNWLGSECELLSFNPFASVKPPKCDKPAVRLISADELADLFAWFAERWNNWQLPIVFIRIAEQTGWRATEVASLTESDIFDGGLVRVRAANSKTRVEKFAQLPIELHEQLRQCGAGGMAFGRFADELRRLLMLWKRRPQHAAKVRDFSPKRLVGWLQDELDRYNESRTDAAKETPAEAWERFTLHDFRGTAITAMQMAGVSEKEASVQVGCTPEVMRAHYERLNGMIIAKRNADRRAAGIPADLVRMHSPRRAGAARPENASLDDASNQLQTVAS